MPKNIKIQKATPSINSTREEDSILEEEEELNTIGSTTREMSHNNHILLDEEDDEEDSLLVHGGRQSSDISSQLYLNEKTIYDLHKKPYVPLFELEGGLKKMSLLRNAYYMFLQYMNFTWKEVTKRKIGYLIGTASCFVVVWMILLSISALSQVPLVFVRLAELQVGEFDAQLSVARTMPGVSLNYSLISYQIENATKDTSQETTFSYHSPRNIYSQAIVYTSCSENLDATLSYDKYSWMYNKSAPCGNREHHDKLTEADYNYGVYCIPQYCSNNLEKVGLYLIDTEREKRMEFGRDYPYSSLKKGHAIFSSSLASNLGIKKGDVVIMRTLALTPLAGPYREAGFVRYTEDLIERNVPHELMEDVRRSLTANSSESTSQEMTSMLSTALFKLALDAEDPSSFQNRRVTFNNGTIFFPVIVDEISNDVYGKMATKIRDYVIMEYDSFLDHISTFFPSQLFSDEEKEAFSRVNHYDYAGEVFFNQPPNRLEAYNENDFKTVRDRVTKYASTVMYLTGFNQLDSSFPILEMMEQTQFFSLFVGLIISIILVVLSSLSIVLIYSLLMINVENRRFEMGLLRMLGLKRFNIVQLILVQAMWYGIPAWIIGMIIGQISYTGVAILLGQTLQAPISYVVSFESFAIATVIGLLVPVISAILPIQAALGQNLHDSLDTQRSVSAVKYSVERAESETISWTTIALGIIGVIFGFGVYYVMPLSLLTFNITIMMYMFMSVILAMLLGLVMLSLNLENIIEFVVVIFTIGIYESSAVVDIVEKNLVAHRERNRKTTLMFALSLGFIIFSSVLFNTQITAFKYNVLRSAGTSIIVGSSNRLAFSLSPAALSAVENFALENPKWVDGTTYWTYGVAVINPSMQDISVRTVGGLVSDDIKIRGIASNFYNITDSKFLKIKDRVEPENSGSLTKYEYNMDQYMYTVNGSYQLMMGSYFKDRLDIDLKSNVILEFIERTSQIPKYIYKLFQVGSFLEASPVALYSAFPRFGTQDLLVSIPTYLRLLGRELPVSALPIDSVFFKLTSATQNDMTEIRTMKRALQKVINPYHGLFIRDVNEELEPIEIAVKVMNFFFLFTTFVAMVICFFSLVSSMYSNINEQAKEIGILRAIGMRKFAIVRAFIYEAFVLVAAAAISGIFIGTIISYTMSLQNTLITELPIDFIFPWQIVLMVFGLAMIFSFLSSFFPIYNLLKMPIVGVLKKLN